MPLALVVDDSPVALRVVSRRLGALGFDVREASTAADARRVDAVTLACAIFDVELSDGNGPDLAAVLRAGCATLPIAFFTSGAATRLLERAHACGPIFLKPDLDGLLQWALAAARLPQPPPTK